MHSRAHYFLLCTFSRLLVVSCVCVCNLPRIHTWIIFPFLLSSTRAVLKQYTFSINPIVIYMLMSVWCVLLPVCKVDIHLRTNTNTHSQRTAHKLWVRFSPLLYHFANIVFFATSRFVLRNKYTEGTLSYTQNLHNNWFHLLAHCVLLMMNEWHFLQPFFCYQTINKHTIKQCFDFSLL